MKQIKLAAVLLLLLPCLNLCVYAGEISAGFTATAVLPDNQLDLQASHYDLLVQPGQEQDLHIQIVNSETEDIELAVETIAASTSRSGSLHYSSPGIYDESMHFPFSALAVPEQKTLTVPARGTVDTCIHITIPQDGFPGVILGSIRILRQPDTAEMEGTGIVNQYSYVIGVRLTQEAGQEAAPAYAMGEVGAELVNHKAAIVAPICNTQPAIAKDLAATARISQLHSDDILIEKTQDNISIAPNSIFPLTLVDEAGYGFPAGEYIATISLQTPQEMLEFQQNFTIIEQTASEVNAGAVNQQQNQSPPSEQNATAPLVWIALAILVGSCGLVLMWRVREYRKQASAVK